MNERLQDLLPWYANGRISAADRAWVDEQLAADPLARAQLAWHRSLRERLQEAAPAVSDSIGLDQALARSCSAAAPSLPAGTTT
jgi:anti-sigma factor RsiW